MKWILILTMFLGCCGIAQAEGVTATDANQLAAAKPLSESCWSMKTGALGLSQVYVLANIAKQYPVAAGNVQSVMDHKTLLPNDQELICRAIDAS